jgi:hypothetical protein
MQDGVHRRLTDYPAALQRIAGAFALDKTGEYRERRRSLYGA